MGTSSACEMSTREIHRPVDLIGTARRRLDACMPGNIQFMTLCIHRQSDRSRAGRSAWMVIAGL